MPSAMTASTRRSILIKSASFLETVADVDTLVLDKTGTVTVGELSLAGIHPLPAVTEDEVLSAAAECGFGSLHPVSRAVVDAARRREVAFSEPTETREVPGKGVTLGQLPQLAQLQVLHHQHHQLESECKGEQKLELYKFKYKHRFHFKKALFCSYDFWYSRTPS